MTDHVTHRAAAERLVQATTTHPVSGIRQSDAFAVHQAQVHATLELARQQQIANLIALFSIDTADLPRTALPLWCLNTRDTLTDPEGGKFALRPDIAADLGVTE